MYSRWNKDKDVVRVFRNSDEIHITANSTQNNDVFENVPLNIEADRDQIRIRPKCYEVFDVFLNDFVHEIQCMGITNKDRNTLYSLMEQLVRQHKNILLESHTCNHLNVINDRTNYVCEQIGKFRTRYRRLSLMRQNKLFVEPETKNIGLKWKTTTRPEEEIPDHELVASTYQFVSPLKTLRTLFADATFRDAYEKYNRIEKHKCRIGVYENFCCGSIFKKSELFKEQPVAIQIEISSDDFEVCSPLKSKATIHKICAVYFRIRNMPLHSNSKLDSIYLVALCAAAYLKTGGHSFQDIAKLIVQDLKQLETIGIEISPGVFLKGTLVFTSHDNLGGNSILGLVECFVANYSCRICECKKEDLQGLFVEDVDKLRKKENYLGLIRELEEDESNANNIKGIKTYCSLNDLEFYHMFENRSVDLMHDVNEGVYIFRIDVRAYR